MARAVCPDPNAVDELLDDALLRLHAKLPGLDGTEKTLRSARKFLRNRAKEMRREKRRREKLGTPTAPEVIMSMDSMMTEPPTRMPGDYEYLVDHLRGLVATLEEPGRRVGRFILQYIRQHGECPTVKTIEQALNLTHGTAQRCRELVLARCCELSLALGFQT